MLTWPSATRPAFSNSQDQGQDLNLQGHGQDFKSQGQGQDLTQQGQDQGQGLTSLLSFPVPGYSVRDSSRSPGTDRQCHVTTATQCHVTIVGGF